MPAATLRKSPECWRGLRQAGATARYPNMLARQRRQLSGIGGHPRMEPVEFRFNRLYFAVGRRMDFDPVDNFGPGRRSIPDCIVPPWVVWANRFQRVVDVDASREVRGLLRLDTITVGLTQSLQSLISMRCEWWATPYAVAEGGLHRRLPRADTASATAWFAPALNSASPPQAASDSLVAPGSSREMSRLVRLSRSK